MHPRAGMNALEVPVTFLYVGYVRATRWLDAHALDVCRALLAVLAAGFAAALAYYFYAALVDRLAACEAATSPFCTRYEPDPYLAADRRRACDWRAHVCTQWTAGMAVRQVAADAWAGSRDFFIAVAQVLWPPAAVLILLTVILRLVGLK